MNLRDKPMLANDKLNVLHVTDPLGQSCHVGIHHETPAKLYRYTKRRFADDLLTRGRLRLGTLYEYSDREDLNESQRDICEGKAVYTFNAGEISPRTTQFYVTSMDRWLVCLSRKLDRELMVKMGHDSVVELDAIKFATIVADKLAFRSKVGSLRPVTYYADSRRAGSGLDPRVDFAHTRKSDNYAWQEEHRLCFERREDTNQLGGSLGRRMELGLQDRMKFFTDPNVGKKNIRRLEPLFVQDSRLAKIARDVTNEI